MTRRTINRPMLGVLIGIVVGALFAGVALTIYAQRATDATEAAQVGAGVVEEVQAACADEDSDPDQDVIRSAGLCDSADQAAAELEASPAEVSVAGPAGRDGATGPAGQDGQDGERGPRGPPPAFTTVLAAVRTSLDEACGGSCEGSRGATGAAGAPGAASTVPGPQGEPGRDGADSTVPGPRGEAGQNGKDAPRVVAIACAVLGGGSFTFTFDDGSTVSADCTSLPTEPDPDPPTDTAPVLLP